MGNDWVRPTKPDDFLKSEFSGASESVGSLVFKIFGFDEYRDSKQTRKLLLEAAEATGDEVGAMSEVVFPEFGESIGFAWQRLEAFTIAFPGWTIGEPAVTENRPIWLGELLRELARFKLPGKLDDALIWLAIHCGTFAEKEDNEFASFMSELFGTTAFQLGMSGCEHVGRWLACEIARNSTVSENLFDTLRLVGTARHPALSPEDRPVPSPHVARGLAGCGHDGAIAALCETITTDRGDSLLAVKAAVQATAAAVEVFSVFPDVLLSVLETLAIQLDKGQLDSKTLVNDLSPVLELPPVLLTELIGDGKLWTCVSVLRERELRQKMMASDDQTEQFLGLWGEAAYDIHACASQILECYEQACVVDNEDSKLLLRTIARLREGRTLAMRPMWLRILREAIEDSQEQLNVSILAEALNFGVASGLTLESGKSVPADEAFDMLIEVERRLRNGKRMAELVAVSSLGSAEEIRDRLIGLMILNLAGRPGDALLPFVHRMDSNSIAVLEQADFSTTDAATRAAIFEKSSAKHPHGPALMVRAVAAADSIDELLEWLLVQYRLRQAVDPLFAIACGLREDRVKLWQTLLLATKKETRQLGLQFVLKTLKVIDDVKRFADSKIADALPSHIELDSDAIRRDASLVLEEYEAKQSQKKRGDDLQSTSFLRARQLSRSSVEIETESDEKQAALVRLSERVAEQSGIDRSRFVPTPPQPPHDRGSCYRDMFGEVAPKLIEAAASFVAEISEQQTADEQRTEQFRAWLDNRRDDLRESDGSERLRVHQWFVGPGNWQYFDEKVINRAMPMMSDTQLQRIEELRPPVLSVPREELLQRLFQSLSWEAKYCYEDILLVDLDWYESVVANLPESIQRLGPAAEHSATPHPPHEQAIAHVYMSAHDWLGSRQVDEKRKERVRKRLWPLLWWAASFGGRVGQLDAAAIGAAVSSGQASLGDLVWYLVQPGHSETAEHLIEAVKYPERICFSVDTERDNEIRMVIEAVAEICREQEYAADPSLPTTLANTWPKMPAPIGQSGLRSVLTKYADIEYQTVGRTNEKQKAFAARVSECVETAEKSWLVAEGYFAPKYVKFEVLDGWLKKATEDLRELFRDNTVPEDTLLRIALDRPLLMRCVMEATGRKDQLEAGIWIIFHSGCDLENLAITLNSDTGHPAIRRREPPTKVIEQRLLEQYAQEISMRSDDPFCAPVEDATIRRSWKQSAIDAHQRERLEPLLGASKAVISQKKRQRMEGLLDAMDGKLDAPARRKELESSIKDRPNLALLQLAVLPLPDGHEALAAEISRRLSTFERLSFAGRKRKSIEARLGMQRALEQARRSLADNAGFSDPVQLDWLSGEAIAKELAEFERLEVNGYVIQLRLRGDGPQVLVTRAGKSLKSIPAVVKSSEIGRRLVELQKRLKLSLRDARSVCETSMIKQRTFSPDDLKMMMKHPVVVTVARDLVFIVEPTRSHESIGIGMPSEDGEHLIALDGAATEISRAVQIMHPIELDRIGILTQWQNLMTDRPPQAFPQLDRAIVRADELETADEGKKIIRHEGVKLENEDQAFRILQAHDWQDYRELIGLCRTFSSPSTGSITAILRDFMSRAGSIGPLEFRDSDGNELAAEDVPPIFLSEAIRDIDRAVSGTQQ